MPETAELFYLLRDKLKKRKTAAGMVFWKNQCPETAVFFYDIKTLREDRHGLEENWADETTRCRRRSL